MWRHVVQVVLCVGYQNRIAVQLKLLLWPAALAYALEVYTWALMVAGNWGLRSSVSLVYLVIGALQLVAVLGAAGISPFMCASAHTEPISRGVVHSTADGADCTHFIRGCSRQGLLAYMSPGCLVCRHWVIIV